MLNVGLASSIACNLSENACSPWRSTSNPARPAYTHSRSVVLARTDLAPWVRRRPSASQLIAATWKGSLSSQPSVIGAYPDLGQLPYPLLMHLIFGNAGRTHPHRRPCESGKLDPFRAKVEISRLILFGRPRAQRV